MKAIYHILIFTFIALLPFSCSNDFLNEKSPDIFESTDPLILSSQSLSNEITLNIPQAGNEKFNITVLPKWLVLETMTGTSKNGILTLKYSVNTPEFQNPTDHLSGTLAVTVDHIGLFRTQLIYGNIGSTPDQSLGNIIAIEGKVIDMAYNKATDQMVIATQSPNRLLVTQTSSGTTSVINLDKSPQCMEISQDAKTVIVGFTIAELAIFNLESKSLIRTYPLDCVPFDLALGQNGWCYISPSEFYDFNLRSLNLTTGKIDAGKNPPLSHQLYGQSEIKKINGRPLLVATRITVSPAGLLLINISKEIPNDTIAYWHENAGKIWLSNNGKLFFADEGQCNFMPDYIASILIQPSFKNFGKLTINQLRINSLDQCEARNSYFVAERNVAIMYENQNNANLIEQFDATSLNLIRKFTPSMTAVKKDGSTVLLNNAVWYVFTNNSGTKLFAIRSVTTDIDVKQWSVETFDLN